jgi:hypothetical protein
MRDFAAIEAIAAERHGGGAALAARLATPLAPAALARLPLSVWLEAMAKALFQAGFSRRVIEAKWPGFQAAFNRWRAESGRPLTQISQILALSVD